MTTSIAFVAIAAVFLLNTFPTGDCAKLNAKIDVNVNGKRRSSCCATGNGHPAPKGVPMETRMLDEIYRAALAEGGRLILYAGGDTAGQQDFTKMAFEQRFPNMTLDVVVDYSKFHGPRIDWQRATGGVVPDAVQLQTLQDFPRWKRLGVLEQYRPAGWDKVHADFRDADGFYTGIMILAFSNVVNSNLLPESEWPRTALDYLKPNLTNQKLVVTYPNDDDAVLFWFKQVIDKYGWQWMERFAAQKPRYVRGTEDPSVFLGNGSGVASMSTFAAATDFLNTTSGSVLRFSYPTDNDPFTLWAQYAGILRGAKHPEAAKLYMNWAIANQMDSSTMLWSVRTDAPPPPFGVPRAWEVPNTSHKAFEAFMADRAEVERLKAQIALYIGEPQGPPSPGYPGLRPEKALPH